MKSISLSIILVGLCATMLKAQPVLTHANTQFVYLEAWKVTPANDSNPNPGSAGANQNWDLSGLGLGSFKVVEVIGPGQSPYHAGSYIIADLSVREKYGSTTVYTYFDTGASSLQIVGVRDWTKSPSFCLTDFWEWMHYPLQYGDSFSDSFSTSSYCDGINSITGTSTLKYDGYGTLVTPTGNFAGVARVRLNANYVIWNPYESSPQPDTFIIEEYRWYQPDIHYPIAKISTTKRISSAPRYVFAPVTTSEYFSSVTTVGIDEKPGVVSGFSVFPVPANDRLHLSINSKRAVEMRITITDISGRVFMEQTVASVPSKTLFDVNIAHLPQGNYAVKLATSEQCETRRFVKY